MMEDEGIHQDEEDEVAYKGRPKSVTLELIVTVKVKVKNEFRYDER